MTADPERGDGGRPAATPVTVDLFLLAGQFPGTSHGQALAHALSYALAAERAVLSGRAGAQSRRIPSMKKNPAAA